MEKLNVWIDSDCGIDDAIAIITACGLKELNIVGASAVVGNVEVDKTYRNVRNVLSLIHREDIPVYKGAAKPIIKPYFSASYFHGSNGLGGAEIPESKAKHEEKNAYDALYEKARELGGNLYVAALGPLSNLAITIADHPDIVNYIRAIAIMGGAVEGGNVTPCAEFNIFCDPHAAEVVFKSGIEVIMCGLDVTMQMKLGQSDIDEIYAYGNKVGDLLYASTITTKQFYRAENERMIYLHDCCPLFYLAHPELFKAVKCGIYVETEGEITLGKTVTDVYSDHKWEDRHCKAVMKIDHDRFIDMVKDIYRSYEE